jgi:ABC-type transport system involved in multi-copper enzyme maturation permease subunit
VNLQVVVEMVVADLLKIRKRIGNVVVALLVACGPLVIFFVVRAAQHSSNSAQHPPAGGLDGFTDSIRLLAIFFGPLAAILIGVDAGAGDASAGVFRDLVATGRSRLALFASRVPAALALTWLVAIGGYALTLLGTFAFASGAPTPDATLIMKAFGFLLLAVGIVCTVAVGLASLLTSRPAALTTFIGWQLVASPIIASISSLGDARRIVLTQAIAHFSPVHIDGSRAIRMPASTAIAVLAVWLAIALALGAWRTRTMDA